MTLNYEAAQGIIFALGGVLASVGAAGALASAFGSLAKTRRQAETLRTQSAEFALRLKEASRGVDRVEIDPEGKMKIISIDDLIGEADIPVIPRVDVSAEVIDPQKPLKQSTVKAGGDWLTETEARQTAEYFNTITSARRQDTAYFIVSIVTGIIGVALVAIGFIAALRGSVSLGVTTGIIGVLPTTFSGIVYLQGDKANKAADSRAKTLTDAVDNVSRRAFALEIAGQIASEDRRDQLLETIALSQIYPDHPPPASGSPGGAKKTDGGT